MNMEMIEHGGEVYLSYTGVLKVILSTYLFPQINEMQAYNICKRKLEYICQLVVMRGYCRNTKEAMKEIKDIKTTEQMNIYVDKIKEIVTDNDIQGILAY